MSAGKNVDASFTEQVSKPRLLRWRFFRKKAELCKRCRAIGLSWSVVAKDSIGTGLEQKDKVCANFGPAQEAVFQKGCPLCVLLLSLIHI